MSNKLPDCTCGANNWFGGGGQMGPGYQFYGRVCDSCGVTLNYVGRNGWWVVLLSPKGFEDTIDFVNGTMVIQARAYKAQWEPLAEAHQKSLYDDLCVEWGLDPTKGVKFHYLHDAPELIETLANGRTISVTDHEYRDSEGNVLDVDHHAFRLACEKMWHDNPTKPSILRAPDPINLPEGVIAYVSRAGEWDRAETVTGELPADPLRVRWDTYFDEVFSQVAMLIDGAITRTEIPNRYYDDKLQAEPWWQFNIEGTTFVVGPRKRVINVDIIFAKPTDVSTLRAIAETDKVTFSTKGAVDDEVKKYLDAHMDDVDKDDWAAHDAAIDKIVARHPEDAPATSVCIHARTQEKLVEYLTLAIQTT